MLRNSLRPRSLLLSLGVAAIYIGAAKLGLNFALFKQNVTLVWPPSGFALAVLILSRFELWPGIVLGALITHLESGIPLPGTLLVTVGNPLEAIIGAYCLLRLVSFRPAFDRVRDILGFIGFAVMLSPIVSATCGIMALYFSGQLEPNAVRAAWFTWWAGDALGILVVAPPLLIWATQRQVHWTRRQIFEVIVLTVSVILVSSYVLGPFPASVENYPLIYLVFPFLIWCAFRFGQRGTTTIALIISIIAVWGTTQEFGPFVHSNLVQSEIFLASFIVVINATSMLLAAVLATSKRIEEELARQRDFATQVMNALGQGVTVTGAQGRFEYVNPAYARMLGYPSSETIIGKTPHEMTLQDDYSILEKATHERDNGESSSYEARLIRSDGGFVRALISGTPRWNNGSIKGAVTVVTDLSALKRTEEALLRSEETNRRVLEQMKTLNNVSLELSKVETFDELCRQAIMLGRSELKFDRLGMWFMDEDPNYMLGAFGTDEDGNLRDERHRRVPFGPTTYQMIDINGGTLRVHFQAEAPIYDDKRQIVGHGWSAMAFLRDGDSLIATLSTDNLLSHQPIEPYQLELLALYANTLAHLCVRKRAEKTLEESEFRFRSIFQGASMGMAVVNTAGYPVSVNPAFVNLTGYTEDELRTMPFSSFTHPEDVPGNLVLFRKLIAGQVEQYDYEKRYVRKDSGIVWVKMHVSRFSTPGEAEDLIIALTEDITKRREAEVALQALTTDLERRVVDRTAELEAANERLTELDRLKTKFIADVSHELRTPLAILNTRVYLLQHSKSEKHAEYLNALKLQIERMTNFVNAVLDLSRLELGADRIAFGAVDLNEVITQVVNALAPRAELSGLTMTFEDEAEIPPVRAEFNQLAQVVTNLVANSINYTPNGGIHICTWLDKNREQVCLEVADTGIGIRTEDMPHLFERFYRGEHQEYSSVPGSGLGLSIVKEIVDLHNGDIQIESQVGKGTICRVWLPPWKNN